MDVATFLETIEYDAAAMMAVGTKYPRDTPVPTCPGWTLGDLIEHTGTVHRDKAEIVRGGWVDDRPEPPDGPDGDLVEWFGLGVVEMLDVFSTADLSRPTWTWCPHDHTADWWVRRIGHETAIHAADALVSAGQPPRVDPRIAVDGIDEILDEMMIGGPDWGTVTPGEGVVALVGGDRRWVVRRASFSGTSPTSGTTYTDLPALVYDDGEPDAVVTATPVVLDLWLWGRTELPAGAVTGDEELVTFVRGVAADATR